MRTPWWWAYRGSDAVDWPGLRPFSAELLDLLTDVETRYADDTPRYWADPHADLSGPEEAEYSRVSDPAKYSILPARSAAWVAVLTERGWAESVPGADWVLPPDCWEPAAGRPAPVATTLRPRRPQAQALVFLHRLGGRSEPPISGVSVGVGTPAVSVTTLPTCGCDACDHGSESLLQELDELAISVVDGSLELRARRDWLTVRTSFGARSGGPLVGLRRPVQVSATPWAQGGVPRRLWPPR